MKNWETIVNDILVDAGLPPDANGRKILFSRNMEAFGYYYFPHILSKPNNRFHKWLYNKSFDILSKPEWKKGVKLSVAAPRGYAKSTLLSFVLPLWCICFERKKYIILISETQGQAEDFLDDIKSELTSNSKLRDDFPTVCGKSDIRWRQEDVILKNEIRVRAIGCGGKIRGRKYRGTRPDLILIDDIESRDSVESDTVRNKLWNSWFLKEVIKAGKLDGTTDFIALGTILHEDSILSKLLDHKTSPDWEKKRFQAVYTFATNQELWDKWANIYMMHEDEDRAAEEAWKFYKEHEEKMLEGSEVLWPEGESYYDLMVMRLTPEGESAFLCFKRGTSVLLDDYSHRNIEDLVAGDSILSGGGFPQKVLDVVKRKTESAVYKIKIAGVHQEIKVTEEHPFLVWPKIQYKNFSLNHDYLYREVSINKTAYRKKTIKNRILNNELVWKYAKDLKVGDAVIQPRPSHNERAHRCDKDWWWLVGYYLAEGYLNYSNYTTCFASHSSEKFLLEKTIDICKKLEYGNTYNIYDPSYGKCKVLALTVCSKPLFDELRVFGRLAHGKFLPDFVDDICYSCFTSLWDGYMAGDGFLITREKISYNAVNSVSENLLLGFQKHWLKFGYISYIYNSRKAGIGEIRGKKHNSRKLYSLQLVGRPTTKRGRVLQAWVYEDKLYSRIQRIEKISEDCNNIVYGISVSGDKTYCVPGAIVHNSEKQNDPIDITRVEIRKEDLKTFTIEPFVGRGVREHVIRLEEEEKLHPSELRTIDELVFYGAWDPSKGKKARTGDYSAIVTVGKDREGVVYVMDFDLKRRDVESRMDDILRLHSRWNYRLFVVESAAFQYFVKEALVKRAAYYDSDLKYKIREDTGQTDKLLRMQGLVPYAHDGTLRFLHHTHWTMEYREGIHQLVGFNAGAKYDDAPDALAMAFEIVKHGVFRRKALINGRTVIIGR